jgi:Xaa-Pro dipeptidase
MDTDSLGPLTYQISPAVISERTDRAREWMTRTGAIAILAYGGPAALGSRTGSAGYLRYLTGWMTTHQPALLVVPLEGRPTVITMGPHDTRAFAMRTSWYADVIATGGVPRYPVEAAAALRELSPSGTVGLLGFSEMPAPLHAATVQALAGYDLLDAEPAVDAMRTVRHPEEIQMHRVGARISDSMIQTAMDNAVLPGMTGARLMADIEHAGRVLGAGTPGTWLATGEMPTTTYMEQMEVVGPIGRRDRVQLGTSLSYGGYFAQGLRIGVRGRPSPALADYAKILLEIQDEALAAMVPGAKLHTVSDAIEAAIDRHCPYERSKDPFRFQSCHGLGLSYAEPGMARDLNARRDKSLDPEGVSIVESMVIEVHPNFTTDTAGHVCAGDMALITKDGAQWITEFPRGLYQL